MEKITVFAKVRLWEFVVAEQVIAIASPQNGAKLLQGLIADGCKVGFSTDADAIAIASLAGQQQPMKIGFISIE